MRLQSLLGVFAMVAIAWALSENRRAVSLKRIAVGLAVTVALALLMLQVKPVRDAFAALNGVVDAIAAATRAGTSFVFGYLGGGTLPFDPKFPGGEFIFAFQALPVGLDGPTGSVTESTSTTVFSGPSTAMSIRTQKKC